jgi:hypothetical protein
MNAIDPLMEDPHGHVHFRNGPKARIMTTNFLQVVQIVQIGFGIAMPPAHFQDPCHGWAVNTEILGKNKAQDDGYDLDVAEHFVESLNQEFAFSQVVPEVETFRHTLQTLTDSLGVGNGPMPVIDPEGVVPNLPDVFGSQLPSPPDMGHEFFNPMKFITLAILDLRNVGVFPETTKQVMLFHGSPSGAFLFWKAGEHEQRE